MIWPKILRWKPNVIMKSLFASSYHYKAYCQNTENNNKKTTHTQKKKKKKNYINKTANILEMVSLLLKPGKPSF